MTSVDIDDYPFDRRTEDLLSWKFDFISRELDRIEFTGDTNAVLRVRFGDSNTYGQFAWALNQAKTYGLRRYAFFDDDFYFLANPAPVRNYETMDLPPIDPVILPFTPLTKWEIFKRNFYFWWWQVRLEIGYNYVLIIGFMLLFLIPWFINIKGRRPKVVL